MPTTRTRRRRIPKTPNLDPSIESVLLTGNADRDSLGWKLRSSRFFDQAKELREMWETHRKYLTAKWRFQNKNGDP